MKKMLLAAFALAALSIAHAPAARAQDCQSCDAALARGVFNTTTVVANSDVRTAYTALQCSSEFSTHQDALDAGLSLGMVVYGVPLSIGLNFSEEQRSAWKRDNCSSVVSNTSALESYTRIVQLASPEILNAWVACKGLCQSVGLRCWAEPRDAENVVFKAVWNPSQGDEGQNPLVRSSSIAGAVPSHNLRDEAGNYILIPPGEIIFVGSGNLVVLARQQGRGAVMRLGTTRGECYAYAPAPPAPQPQPQPQPAPVYEVRYFETDEAGWAYSQDFTTQCQVLPFPQNLVRKGISEGEFRLANSSGIIHKVDYNCVGHGCGWSYHPDGRTPAHWEYAGKTALFDAGRAFRWFRKYQRNDCRETYRAFYKLPRTVCVQNCGPAPAPGLLPSAAPSRGGLRSL
jgi:hypothetical protein